MLDEKWIINKAFQTNSVNILKLNYYIFSKKSTKFFSSAHGGGVVDPLPTEKYVYKECCRNIFHSRFCVWKYMYEFSASGRDNTVRKAAFTETLIEFYYQFQVSYLSLKFHNVTY